MDDARAIIGTEYGATSRTGAVEVKAVQGGGIRLAVSHTDPAVDSYTSKFCTGLEMPPAKWREVIPLLLELLPPVGTPDPFLPDPDGTVDLDDPLHNEQEVKNDAT